MPIVSSKQLTLQYSWQETHPWHNTENTIVTYCHVLLIAFAHNAMHSCMNARHCTVWQSASIAYFHITVILYSVYFIKHFIQHMINISYNAVSYLVTYYHVSHLLYEVRIIPSIVRNLLSDTLFVKWFTIVQQLVLRLCLCLIHSSAIYEQ